MSLILRPVLNDTQIRILWTITINFYESWRVLELWRMQCISRAFKAFIGFHYYIYSILNYESTFTTGAERYSN